MMKEISNKYKQPWKLLKDNQYQTVMSVARVLAMHVPMWSQEKELDCDETDM